MNNAPYVLFPVNPPSIGCVTCYAPVDIRKHQWRLIVATVRYVQDKVRPGTGREGALGYERYIAGKHMDVRRDCASFARVQNIRRVCNLLRTGRYPKAPVALDGGNGAL